MDPRWRLRRGSAGAGTRRHALGRIHRRRRSVRPGVLRHLAARGRPHGPAAAPAAADRLAGAGGCGNSRRADRRLAHRRLCRHLAQRLSRHPEIRTIRDRRAYQHGRRIEHRGQPALASARPARTKSRGRHRVLLLAGRARSRVSRARARRVRHGARRRREPHAHAGRHDHVQPRRDALAGRALQGLRCAGERLCARRRRRHRHPQAVGPRASGRRSRARRHPRDGREPGRPDQHADGAESRGAGRDAARGVRPRRGRSRAGSLCRGARHRHRGRRSDRGAGDRDRVRFAARRRRALPHRLDQDQHRAPRAGGRHRRADQGRALRRAWPDSAEPAFQRRQSEHRHGGAQARGLHRARGISALGGAAARGRQLVRLRRDQRVGDPARTAAARPRASRERGPREAHLPGPASAERCNAGVAARQCRHIGGCPFRQHGLPCGRGRHVVRAARSPRPSRRGGHRRRCARPRTAADIRRRTGRRRNRNRPYRRDAEGRLRLHRTRRAMVGDGTPPA